MPAHDLLDWIDRRSVTGVLTVEWSSTVREFIFDSGVVVASASNLPNEHLDQWMLRSDLVDESLLDGARQMQRETGMNLSRIFQIVGAVTEQQVQAVSEHRARESLLDVISWPEGTFTFDRTFGESAPVEVPLSLGLRSCIDEGRKRERRWKHIRALIPRDDTVLQMIARRPSNKPLSSVI